jgi:hypothetical protein
MTISAPPAVDFARRGGARAVSVLPSLVGPALILACLLAELSFLRVGVDDLDEGYFVQQAVRVWHGQIPYRDFETLYTPGLLYLHAGLFAALGGPYILGPRALSLLSGAALALLMYVLARPLVRSSVLAALPAVFLLVGLDDSPDLWEPHPGWLSAIFGLLTVWCLTHRPSTRWLLASGAAAGATYLFKQNAGVFVLAAIVARGAFASHGRRTQIGLPLVAFVAFTALWLVPLLIAMDGRLALLGVFVGAVNQASMFAPPELPLLIPVTALVWGAWLARRPSHSRLRWYVLAGAALFLTQYPRMDALHLEWSAPLLLVVGAVCLDQLRTVAVLPILIAPLLLFMPTVTWRQTALAMPTVGLSGVPFANGLRAPEATASDLRAIVAEVQQRTRPGEPIFVYPTSPLLYALAERPNPTRYDHLNPGAADPGQIEQIIADLTRAHVQLVVVSDFWVGAWGPPGPNSALVDWIDAHFSQVAQFHAYRVLAASL